MHFVTTARAIRVLNLDFLEVFYKCPIVNIFRQLVTYSHGDPQISFFKDNILSDHYFIYRKRKGDVERVGGGGRILNFSPDRQKTNSIFSFLCQNLKNQIRTTNLWVEQVNIEIILKYI